MHVHQGMKSIKEKTENLLYVPEITDESVNAIGWEYEKKGI